MPWLRVRRNLRRRCAKLYAAQAAKQAGWTSTVARAKQTRRTRLRKAVPDHPAFRFLSFAVETCGYIGKEAVRFVQSPSVGTFPSVHSVFSVRAAVQLTPVAIGEENTEMQSRSGWVISHEQGMWHDARFSVPGIMS